VARTRGRLRGTWTAFDGRSMFARTTAWEPPKQNPPVVLVHGMGISSSYMVRLAEELSRDTKVYAPDLPGYGRSGANEILSLEQLGASLSRWIDAVGLGRPLLVGNSFGCQVIAEQLHQCPGQASGIIFIGPTLDGEARPLGRLLPRWAYEAVVWESEMSHLVWRDYFAAGPRRAIATLGMMRNDEIAPKLQDLDIPVLLARGEHDPISSERWLFQLQEVIPHARVRTIPGTAHPANFLEPESTARLVREFHDRLAPTTLPMQEEAR
jgi:2-hydroxy-6-oxonona-2,4-dienedioate hydrolase